MNTASAVEKALGLSEEIPTDTEMLFPEHVGEYELLDGTKVKLNIKPWGLGRFVQAQAELSTILIEFSAIFKDIDFEKFDETLSTEMLVSLMNLITPHIQILLLITLGAKDTFKDFELPPTNIKAFVDELPISVSVNIILVIIKQNWRHIKNVLGLDEVKAAVTAISAGQ